MYTVGLETDTRAYFTGVTILISLPTGTKIFNWLSTYLGNPPLLQLRTSSGLFGLLFLLMFTIGGSTGVILGNASVDLGLQLGNETDATVVGLTGKLKLTGGSDKSGVPMRSDVHGSARKRVLLSKGVGLQAAEHGDRVRKLTRGNIISEEIYQINCKFDGELPVEKPAEEASTETEDKKE
jgi:small subunit ribosomal protein S6e